MEFQGEESVDEEEDDKETDHFDNGQGHVFGKSGNLLENNSIVFFEKEAAEGDDINEGIIKVTKQKNEEIKEQKRMTMKDTIGDTIKYLDA